MLIVSLLVNLVLIYLIIKNFMKNKRRYDKLSKLVRDTEYYINNLYEEFIDSGMKLKENIIFSRTYNSSYVYTKYTLKRINNILKYIKSNVEYSRVIKNTIYNKKEGN